MAWVGTEPRKFMKRPHRQLSRVCYQLIAGTKMNLYLNMSLDQGHIYISFDLLIDFILFIKVAFHALNQKSEKLASKIFLRPKSRC